MKWVLFLLHGSGTCLVNYEKQIEIDEKLHNLKTYLLNIINYRNLNLILIWQALKLFCYLVNIIPE